MTAASSSRLGFSDGRARARRGEEAGPARVDDHGHAGGDELGDEGRDRVGIEAGWQAAADDDDRCRAPQPNGLGDELGRLGGRERRAVLVEDARVAARLVDDRDAAPGLAGDRHERVAQAAAGEVVGESCAGRAAGGGEGEHLVPLGREHPSDVDALAAGARRAGRHPVGLTRQQPVDVPGEVFVPGSGSP